MREDILARGEDPASYPVLNSRPELFQDLLWIWEGFMVLTTHRQAGMAGPQPISMTEILAYCEFEGLRHPDDREEFLHHITKLDRIFLADWRARNPASKNSRTSRPRLGG